MSRHKERHVAWLILTELSLIVIGVVGVALLGADIAAQALRITLIGQSG
jgi:hypothetical protein